MTEPWQEMLSDEQRRLFNAACGDLSRCMTWHGFRLSKDDWRHFISGTILGWRLLPGCGGGPVEASLDSEGEEVMRDQEEGHDR